MSELPGQGEYNDCVFYVDIWDNKGHLKPIWGSAAPYYYYTSYKLNSKIVDWLIENIGEKFFYLSPYATNAAGGVWATIFFKDRNHRMLFKLTWC